MVAKLNVPGVKIRQVPFLLAWFLPKGFSITMYPYILLAKEVMAIQPDEIIQHELYHANRQKEARYSWFKAYLTKKDFKFDEEARGYAFGFCFLDPLHPLDRSINWAGSLLASKNYSNCAPSSQEAINLIRKYYDEFNSL